MWRFRQLTCFERTMAPRVSWEGEEERRRRRSRHFWNFTNILKGAHHEVNCLTSFVKWPPSLIQRLPTIHLSQEIEYIKVGLTTFLDTPFYKGSCRDFAPRNTRFFVFFPRSGSTSDPFTKYIYIHKTRVNYLEEKLAQFPWKKFFLLKRNG